MRNQDANSTIASLVEELARRLDVYVAPLAGMNAEAAILARELRRHDLTVELGDESFRLKKSLETASKIGARYVVIVGDNEIKSGVFALKNLATHEQMMIPRAELPKRIQERAEKRYVEDQEREAVIRTVAEKHTQGLAKQYGNYPVLVEMTAALREIWDAAQANGQAAERYRVLLLDFLENYEFGSEVDSRIEGALRGKK